MVIVTKWFDVSDDFAGKDQGAALLYSKMKIDEMVPDGVLESLDLVKAMPLAIKGVPVQPRKETFALASKDGRSVVRYFFNFNPQNNQMKANVRLEHEGKHVVLQISADEYQRAKKIFEAGVKQNKEL